MQKIYEKIANLKYDQYADALCESIQIEGSPSGNRLVPVGHWILQSQELISAMSEWRRESRNNFFARFPSSVDSMREYLISRSIGQFDTILFVIYSDEEGFIGHLGIASISQAQAEIDAVMVSPRLRGRGVASFAVPTLIEWARTFLGIKTFVLDVLSSNESAISLYHRMGFEFKASSPLKVVSDGIFTQLRDCEIDESDSDLYRISMKMQ